MHVYIIRKSCKMQYIIICLYNYIYMITIMRYIIRLVLIIILQYIIRLILYTCTYTIEPQIEVVLSTFEATAFGLPNTEPQ